jgi:CYTH domain-containing protein
MVDSRLNDAHEIERRFLLGEAPEVCDGLQGVAIRQGYVAAKGEVEVRLRSKGDKYFLTIKRGAGLVREEREIELSALQFEELWPSTEGWRLEKTRFEAPLEGRTLEVDVYAGPLAGLVVGELEFPTIGDAAAFSPPAWLGVEITDDRRYSNRNLARFGRPTD